MNKSEEARFLKQFDAILKLRHILLTSREEEQARTYAKQVLLQYYSEDELLSFGEQGFQHFINAVRTIHQYDLRSQNAKDFILSIVQPNRSANV